MILRYNILAILWALLILLLSLVPGKNLPEINLFDFLSFDKLAHVFMYAMLVFLLTTGCKRQYAKSWLRYHAKLTAFWISFSYGLLLEITQLLLTTDRYFDWLDVIANTLGAAVGIVFFLLIYGKQLSK